MSGWGWIAMILWTHRYLPVSVPNYDQVGSVSYYVIRLVSQLIVFAIPAFLFISGLFLAFATGRDQRNVPLRTVFGRIKFLVIPYLIWSMILICGLLLEGKSLNPVQTIGQILTGDISGPYYFIPLLVQLYLLAPFMVPFASKHWKSLLLVTGLIQLITQALLYPLVLGIKIPYLSVGFQIPSWSFPNRIFWLALGLVVGFHLPEFKAMLAKVKWSMLALTLILFVVGFYEWEIIFQANQFFTPIETVIDSFYALFFIFTFLAFDKAALPLTRQINKLGSNVYGIYLAHVPAQEYTARIIYHLAPWLLGQQLLFMPIIFIAGLVFPLLLMEVFRRSPISRFYQYVFG